MGALHPILFFTLVYGISLFLAIFVCRTIYYSINEEPTASSNQNIQANYSATNSSATALR